MLRVIASALLLLAAPLSAEDVRHTVLLAGNRCGVQTTSVAPDGERRYTFEYNDRGRGPKLTSRIRLAPNGTPVLVETEGNDYLKVAVSESFTLTGGQAAWKNKGESGTRAIASPAFYSSFDGVPDEIALLAGALLASPDRRLALLPEGEARIEPVDERTVTVEGKPRRVLLYAIAGLGFSPYTVWLDEDGGYFASVSAWFSVVREGAEAVSAELLAAEDAAAGKRAEALAGTAIRRPAAPVVFRGARVFDAQTATARDGVTVVVSGGFITAVGPDASVAVPKGAEVVDAKGKTLLPGLWDMHTHVSDDQGPLNIAAGVTSVRDLANDVDLIARLSKAWDTRAAVGPRVIAAGFIDGPGPYAGPTKALADTVEGGIAWIDRYAKLGYPQIKLYSSLKPELVAPLAAEAHRRGMRVSGHIPAFMTAEQAVRDGYDEIQHVNMLFLNFWADTVKDTRTPLRFTAVAEKAADLDLGSERVKAFVRLLKERGTVVDPTVSVFESMFTDRAGVTGPGYAAVADRLPVDVRRSLLGGGLPVPEGMDQRYRDSFRATLRMVKLLHDSGVPIVAGTDALAGFALHRELELYVEAGIPAAEVLRIATIGAARVMKRDAELGSVTVGKKADLALVGGDPTRRISDVRNTELVVKDGAVYDLGVVRKALGIGP